MFTNFQYQFSPPLPLPFLPATPRHRRPASASSSSTMDNRGPRLSSKGAVVDLFLPMIGSIRIGQSRGGAGGVSTAAGTAYPLLPVFGSSARMPSHCPRREKGEVGPVVFSAGHSDWKCRYCLKLPDESWAALEMCSV